MRSQRIDFRTFDGSHITYGNRVREVKYTQGTTPEDFVRIYQELSNKYGLCVTEDFLSRFYKKDLSLTERLELPFPYINYLVGFVLDTHYLLEKGVNIRPLISEFNKSNSSSEFRHTIHLSVIAAVYTSGGYSIEFLRKSKRCKTADLTIDGIPADLKLIKPTDMEKRHAEKGEKFESELREDLCYDIGKAIENRMCIGVEQADLVFIDLGAKSLPMMYVRNILQNPPDIYSLILPEPKKSRIIFCCIVLHPNNLNRRKQGLPYSFYSTYIDIEPNLWNFIRQSDMKIIHRKVEGEFNIDI